MKYSLLTIWLLVISGTAAFSQRNITIYADVKSNDTLQKMVNILTTELKKSSSGSFSVQPASSYNGSGIYMSTATESRNVKPSAQLLKAGVEGYSVDANEQTVRIMGNSNMAVGHGVFSYLESLGYRYYFANPDWHIVPSRPDLFRKWNTVSSPSFYHRRIWYGYGTGSKIADADYNFWVLANKLGGSMNASFGHSYEDIAWRNKDAFFQHPEWFYPVAPKGTIPSEAKFDMTKEDLVQLIIQDVEKRIETSMKNKTNDYKMISLGPSDGVGVCNTPACQQLGSPTDRVYYLTNRVARAIRKKFPGTLIGCMGYSEYSTPPSKRVEPNVFVAITTGFNTSKYSIEQLVEEWKKKSDLVGIYDFFSWYAWDYDLPGRSQASRPMDMIASIKKYHAKGIRAYEGESSIGWVSKGLGYYLAARQMWNVNADPVPARKEFFRLCFNKAAGVMEKMWNEWEKYPVSIVREGALAQWIDYVSEAESMEKSEAVNARLFQIKCYLHYLTLYRHFQSANNEANLTALLNFGYRKLDDGSVAGFPAFFELGNRSSIPGMAYNDNAKWKHNNTPIGVAEINRLLKEDRASLKVSETVKEYATDSKFSNVPNLERYKSPQFQRIRYFDSTDKNLGYWYRNEWVIQIKKKGQENYLDMNGHFIENPNLVKPIKITIYPFTADGNVSDLPILLSHDYTLYRVKQRISLQGLNPGQYTMIIDDPLKMYTVWFSDGINHSMIMRPGKPIRVARLNFAFIYVPQGIKRFNVLKTGLLAFVTPAGREISYMNNETMDLQIDVREGEAGLWRIKEVYGDFFVEGIPPYLGTSPQHMLIPAGIK